MEKVINFLKANSLCTVATSYNDMPRASVVEYYMAGDSIVFATSSDSIKATNLAKNDHISMSVHNMPLFVTVDGCVVEPTAEEIEVYNSQLMAHHPEFFEMIEKGMMPPFSYFKIVPETVYYNDYSQGMVPTEIIKA